MHRFLYFSAARHPLAFEAAPSGWPPRRGLAGVDLGDVRRSRPKPRSAQRRGCVRLRSFAPSNPDVDEGCDACALRFSTTISPDADITSAVDVDRMPARLQRCAHTPMLPTIVPTMMRALVVSLRGVGGIILQVDRLGLALSRHVEQRTDVAIIQLAGELQASVDEHADALAQQFFGTNGRTELTGVLSFVADLVEAALDPFEAAPSGWSPRGGARWRVTW